MKVLLVSNYGPDGQYSMLGFSKALQGGFEKRKIEVLLVAPEVKLYRDSQPDKLKKWIAYFDKFVLFPRTLSKISREFDVVHICDHGNAMYTKQIKMVPTLVTCHDLNAVRASLGEIPGWVVGKSGQTFQRLILDGLRSANHVACVSNATMQDLQSLTARKPDTNSVVLNSLYRNFSKQEREFAISQLTSITGEFTNPFLLHVGGNQPYKNREGAMRIMDRFITDKNGDWQGILAGKKLDESNLVAYNGLKNKDRIRVCTDLSDSQIESLYSLAHALIFPSTLEGFGLPILEAQACECPVVTTNKEPMTEVAGDGAVFINPADIFSSAMAIPTDSGEISRLKERGKKNLERFTEQLMLDGYLTIYKSLSNMESNIQSK